MHMGKYSMKGKGRIVGLPSQHVQGTVFAPVIDQKSERLKDALATPVCTTRTSIILPFWIEGGKRFGKMPFSPLLE